MLDSSNCFEERYGTWILGLRLPEESSEVIQSTHINHINININIDYMVMVRICQNHTRRSWPRSQRHTIA